MHLLYLRLMHIIPVTVLNIKINDRYVGIIQANPNKPHERFMVADVIVSVQQRFYSYKTSVVPIIIKLFI